MLTIEQLPANSAAHDEPIPDLGERPWDGPDMKRALPIEMMLGLLHQAGGDPSVYVALWLKLVRSVGGWPILTISRDGEEKFGLGRPCDAQYRHRERWLHFLSQDLNSEGERRDTLITNYMMRGRYIDNRPADPRQTTRVLRDFLRTDGHIKRAVRMLGGKRRMAGKSWSISGDAADERGGGQRCPPIRSCGMN